MKLTDLILTDGKLSIGRIGTIAVLFIICWTYITTSALASGMVEVLGLLLAYSFGGKIPYIRNGFKNSHPDYSEDTPPPDGSPPPVLNNSD